MSKTMAINLVPGIFGTSSFQPTLQNGWMLTSMQGSADNTKALDDFTTLATALVGGGAKGAAGTAAAKTKAAAIPGEKALPTEDPVLPPGLYEFRYDENGRLIGLCTIDTFSHASGVTPTHLCPSLDALASMNAVPKY